MHTCTLLRSTNVGFGWAVIFMGRQSAKKDPIAKFVSKMSTINPRRKMENEFIFPVGKT